MTPNTPSRQALRDRKLKAEGFKRVKVTLSPDDLRALAKITVLAGSEQQAIRCAILEAAQRANWGDVKGVNRVNPAPYEYPK